MRDHVARRAVPERNLDRAIEQVGRESVERRLWPRTKPEGDCWVWTGAKGNDWGYGAIGIGRRRFVVSRVAWTLEHGPIPDGMHVLHHCDNPPCIKPSHLFLGTRSDNMRDMHEKNRGVRGKRWHATHDATHVRGSAHANAKLDEASAANIRRRAQRGESCTALGREFGVSESLVRLIRNGRVWRHVA